MEEDNLENKINEKLNLIKYKINLDNIKSKYIIKNIFTKIQRQKTLDIVKYNKNIKNKLNINTNDYKEYSEKYSTIVIELKPIPNKSGNFINIKKGEEKYYHIYFNNSNEEIKRNYIIENEQVKIIKIVIDYQIISFEQLFANISCIEYLNFKKFYRNNINNMSLMFFGCSSLVELTLDNFNTNSVTNMSYMFYGCSLLKELNLNNFNTNNVTDMSYMFYGCSSLNELSLINLITNNVTNMHDMFDGCSSLKELNLNNFNTDNVKDMYGMFYECSSLQTLNINNFNTNNVKDKRFMFKGCSNELKIQIKTQYKNIKEAFL